jgi:hypothetical protein
MHAVGNGDSIGNGCFHFTRRQQSRGRGIGALGTLTANSFGVAGRRLWLCSHQPNVDPGSPCLCISRTLSSLLLPLPYSCSFRCAAHLPLFSVSSAARHGRHGGSCVVPRRFQGVLGFPSHDSDGSCPACSPVFSMLFFGRPWISFCFCVRRGGKKEVGLVRTSKELSRMSVSDNGKTTQVRP